MGVNSLLGTHFADHFARHLADAFGLGDLAALVLALLSHQRPNENRRLDRYMEGTYK